MAVYDITPSGGAPFEIKNMRLVDAYAHDFSFNTCAQGIFNDDGTVAFFAGGSDGISIAELSVAYDISTAVCKKRWIAPDGLSGSLLGIAFNDTGTKFFWSRGTRINSIDLDIAYDLFSYDLDTVKRKVLNASLRGLVFKSDGTKFFGIDQAAVSVAEYAVSSAWDISTASFTDNTSVNSEDTVPTGLAFKSDGTKFFVLGDTGNDINEYNCTAWDASTKSFVDATSIAAQDASTDCLFFNAAGTKLYFYGKNNDSFYEYGCTAFDASTISYNDALATYTARIETNGLFIGNGGLSLYTAGADTLTSHIRQYDLASSWTLAGINYLRKLNISAAITTPEDVIFNSGGTKMLVLDGGADDITEYTLSSGWDISTASVVDALSVAGQQTGATGLTSNATGTALVITGDASADNAYTYTLGTGFDVSTGSFTEEIDIAGASPTSIELSSDGLHMYVTLIQTANDLLYHYKLGTAYDLNTAYLAEVIMLPENPAGFRISPDGTKAFVLIDSGDCIFEYSLV